MKLRLNRCQSFLCRLGLIKGHTAHDDIYNRSLKSGHGLNRCLDSLLNRQRNLAHALAKLDQNAQLYADCILLAQLYAHALVLALLAQQACILPLSFGGIFKIKLFEVLYHTSGKNLSPKTDLFMKPLRS